MTVSVNGDNTPNDSVQQSGPSIIPLTRFEFLHNNSNCIINFSSWVFKTVPENTNSAFLDVQRSYRDYHTSRLKTLRQVPRFWR